MKINIYELEEVNDGLLMNLQRAGYKMTINTKVGYMVAVNKEA